MSDQITTAAELAALPVGSVVARLCSDGRGNVAYALTDDGWRMSGERIVAPRVGEYDLVGNHIGPLAVLYRPDAPARTEPVTAATAYDLGVKEGLRLSRTKPAKEDEIAEAACRSSDYTLEGVTLAQDAAEASLQLAEPMMDAAAGILADDKNSAELPTRQAWNAAFLEIGVAITYGLLDVAAAIRESDHA